MELVLSRQKLLISWHHYTFCASINKLFWKSYAELGGVFKQIIKKQPYKA